MSYRTGVQLTAHGQRAHRVDAPQPPAGALAQNGTLSVTLDGFAIGHGDATGLGGAPVG
ncbi:MAG: hypothetical protein U0X20_11390 [Caldilineaceae bacterium]